MRAKLSEKYVRELAVGKKPFEVSDSEIAGFLLRVQPSGVKSFYVRYRNAEGQSRRFRLGLYGTLTVPGAREAAKHHLRRVAAGEDIQNRKKLDREAAERAKAQTFNGFVERYYRDYCLSTLKRGDRTLQYLTSSFSEFAHLPLTDFNEFRLTRWKNQKLKSGIRPATVNRVVGALKAMLSRAVEWGVITYNPLSTLKPLKVDSNATIRFLSKEELHRLRVALEGRESAMRDRRERFNTWREARHLSPLPSKSESMCDYLKPMVLVALNTGMRRGELFNLEWCDIDFSHSVVAVRGEKAKNSKTRIIPLNQEALITLKTWRATHSGKEGLVFRSPKTGARIDNINKSWANLLSLAGIKNFRFHDLRHSFASWLVMKGVDLNTVRELLGHSDIKMTLRYAHLAPEHKAAAVAVLGG